MCRNRVVIKMSHNDIRIYFIEFHTYSVGRINDLIEYLMRDIKRKECTYIFYDNNRIISIINKNFCIALLITVFNKRQQTRKLKHVAGLQEKTTTSSYFVRVISRYELHVKSIRISSVFFRKIVSCFCESAGELRAATERTDLLFLTENARYYRR